MSSQPIVNLTGVIVVEEIEAILESYGDDHPRKAAFGTPEARKKLTQLVLSKMPNRYAHTKDEQGRIIYPDFSRCSLEQRLHIEELIKQSMEEIWEEIEVKELQASQCPSLSS